MDPSPHASEGYQNVKCSLCGKIEENYFMEPKKSDMVEKELCFSCLSWLETFEQVDPQICFMVGTTHYITRPGDDKSPFRGHGGARFVIKLEDGSTVVSTNLWCQGEVPMHLLSRFKGRHGEFIWEDPKE